MQKMTLVSLAALFVAAFPPGILPASAGQTCEGEIEFTYVPPFGSQDDLEGLASGVSPDHCKVAVYIYVSGWWTKPTWAEPLTPIQNNGTWTCDITTGGQDECATKIIAFLVPSGYDPPQGSGQQCLPSELYQYFYAEATRFEKIGFGGYDWWVKRHCEKVGPGPNYFEDNAWVDASGDLHLRINQRDTDWYCSEVIAQNSFGYGTYIFTVKGRVDLLDENIVLGLFTWEDCVPEHNYREIDIELSRWGDPANDNAQFVVQPWNTPGNMHRFNIDLAHHTDQTTTHVFTWSQDEICFRSYYGDFSLVPRPDDLIACWSYRGSDIPPPGAENPRINFWLVEGSAPTNGQDAEIVIESFRYVPVEHVAADIDFDPDTLNVKSKGKFLTAYIELPQGFDVSDIDVGRTFLEGLLEVQHSDVQDGVLMVKFDRQDLTIYLGAVIGVIPPVEVSLTVLGELTDGTPFEGADTIRIIEGGRE